MEGQTHLSQFIPRKALAPPPAQAEDLTVELKGGTLPVRLFPASEKAPMVFFYPAERQTIDHYDRLGRYFQERDLTLAVIGYRGMNEGRGEASFDNIFEDAKEAFWVVKERLAQKGRKGPISLLGRSLGAGVALRVAVETPGEISALILDSPIVDGLSWLAHRGLSWPSDPFQVLELIKGWRKPLLIFQAQLDEEVSLPEAEKLLIFCAGHNKRLLIMPGFRREETVEKGGPLYAETIAELLNRLASRFGWKRKTH